MRSLVFGLLIAAALTAGCATTPEPRFVSCENVHGGGFFWLDSSSGKLWWADKMKSKWLYCGIPENAEPGSVGRYILNKNKGGAGVFVLDTETGKGWWSNTTEWSAFGTPEEK